MVWLEYNNKIQALRMGLAKVCDAEQTIKVTYGATNDGWKPIEIEFSINISELARKFNCSRNCIKNELLRGMEQKLIPYLPDKIKIFRYSAQASWNRRLKILAKLMLNIQDPKLPKCSELLSFVLDAIKEGQSLFGIAGRLQKIKKDLKERADNGDKIAIKLLEEFETISAATLYKYSRNKKVKGIDSNARFRKIKNNKRKSEWKRMNGMSINFRPDEINNRKVFGHWEMDLKGVAKSSPCQLLVLQERLTRYVILVVLHDRKAATVVNAIHELQRKGWLVFGENCKSITTDNGSEFWSWEDFSKSINTEDKIDVYFAHPHSPWEKGGVENINLLIKDILGDKIMIDETCKNAIEELAKQLNRKWRSTLNFNSALEMYTKHAQNTIRN